MGLDWSGLIGLRPQAQAQPSRVSDAIEEFVAFKSSVFSIQELKHRFRESETYADADVLISMIPQSDMAISSIEGGSRPWVAYVRGLPWPERGEKPAPVRALRRRIETRALRRADAVWATTQVLGESVAEARRPTIVPAGIEPLPRINYGEQGDRPIVWAGRLVQEKRPDYFLEVAALSKSDSRMFGEGPMRAELERAKRPNDEILGWASASVLWNDVSIYVGTSLREAFGRSVVEAASAGVPVILSDQYGAAPFIFTDPELRRKFVLPPTQIGDWVSAVQDLREDDALRAHVSNHVHENALRLSIVNSINGIMGKLEAMTT